MGREMGNTATPWYRTPEFVQRAIVTFVSVIFATGMVYGVMSLRVDSVENSVGTLRTDTKAEMLEMDIRLRQMEQDKANHDGRAEERWKSVDDRLARIERLLDEDSRKGGR